MTFTEAATLVLRLVGKPLHYKEITDVAIEKSLLSHVGKSPEVTMGARLAAQVKKADKDNVLTRVKPGVFALAEWDEKTVEEGLKDRTPALERLKKLEAESEREVEGATPTQADETTEPSAKHREVDDALLPPDEEEQHRAELSASARELFEAEDDDDQPIFGGEPERKKGKARDSNGGSDSDADSDEETDDDSPERTSTKRRRRRRRGKRRDDDDSSDDSSDDLPRYTVSDAPADEPEQANFGDEPEDASLADSLAALLKRYDKNKGPVSAQNLADALGRSGKGQAGSAGALLAAAEADRLAAERQGRLAKFRISGHRIGLTEWAIDKKTADKYAALSRAASQAEDATASALTDQLGRLPHRALGELVLVLLDRMGVSDLKAVKRPGSHGSELHLSGRMALLGQDPGERAAGAPVAIVVRRDGKDIGRERVTELRGALHHYGHASFGLIVSTGLVLSGAREESSAPGGTPVSLIGKQELSRLCIAHGVGVTTQRIECPMLDFNLFEALAGR